MTLTAAGAINTILGSKHDLSAPGRARSKPPPKPRFACFVTRRTRPPPDTPLWNRSFSKAAYVPYSSSTTKAAIGQPTGASKLCLSCHDGTVALGMVNTRPTAIDFAGGITRMPLGPSNLGTDLSDDHPISFVYDSALAAARGELRDPVALTGKVKLDDSGQMQCTSCHDPHDNQYGMFLVENNKASALCVTCHIPGLLAGLVSQTLQQDLEWHRGESLAEHFLQHGCGQRLRELPRAPQGGDQTQAAHVRR